MSTNVDSWGDIANLGAIYPFPGIEWALAIIAVVIWLAWHCWQIRSENAEYDAAHRMDSAGISFDLRRGQKVLWK